MSMYTYISVNVYKYMSMYKSIYKYVCVGLYKYVYI